MATIGEVPNVVQKRQGDKTYYFGTLGSDKVKNLTFVPVLELSKKTFLSEDSNQGYQRPGSLARMRAFMKFLSENPNSIVPPVLLSDRGKWRFVADKDGSATGRLKIEGLAAIIDGQHRLGGYVALFEKENKALDVPFILLEGLSQEEEMREFIVVNNSQKGVPKSLTAYLEDSDEAQVSWALNEADDSPFKGRITRTTLQRPHLFALHSFAKQVKRLFSVGPVADLDVETKADFVARFWTIIADTLPEEWSDVEKLDDTATRGREDFDYKLLELTGLIAWALVGAQIFARSYSESTGMNWDNVRRLVDAAAAVDWKKEGQYAGRTGEAGGKFMSDDMLRLLPAEAATPETASG